MKSISLPLALIISLAVAAHAVADSTNTPSASAASATNSIGPKIQFATPVYEFGRVNGGEPVKYTFVFTNVGDATLQVSNVKPGCGCTTAGAWTRSVEPGKTGDIPIQFNSGTYNGPVTKQVTVTSNDKNQPTTILLLKGTVWRPITINPSVAVINVLSDAPSNAPTTISIHNNSDEVLTLSAPACSNPAFSAELKTITPGKDFQLIVGTVPPISLNNGNGEITLKTSFTNPPTITVRAIALVRQTVAVSPSQIVLAANLSTNSPTLRPISIQNNGQDPLNLSDPSVNLPEIQVALKTVIPGRQYTVNLTFPPGFEITPGQHVEFTVKSSNPKYPTITVPIQQMPHSNPPTAAITPPLPTGVH